MELEQDSQGQFITWLNSEEGMQALNTKNFEPQIETLQGSIASMDRSVSLQQTKIDELKNNLGVIWAKVLEVEKVSQSNKDQYS